MSTWIYSFSLPTQTVKVFFWLQLLPRGADQCEFSAKEPRVRFASAAIWGEESAQSIKKRGAPCTNWQKRVRLSVWGVFVRERVYTCVRWGWVCPSLSRDFSRVHAPLEFVRYWSALCEIGASGGGGDDEDGARGSRRQIQLHIHTNRTQRVEFLDRHLHGAAAPPRLLPSSDRPSLATPFQLCTFSQTHTRQKLHGGHFFTKKRTFSMVKFVSWLLYECQK